MVGLVVGGAPPDGLPPRGESGGGGGGGGTAPPTPNLPMSPQCSCIHSWGSPRSQPESSCMSTILYSGANALRCRALHQQQLCGGRLGRCLPSRDDSNRPAQSYLDKPSTTGSDTVLSTSWGTDGTVSSTPPPPPPSLIHLMLWRPV